MCVVCGCPNLGGEITGLCGQDLDAWCDSPEFRSVERDAAGLAIRTAEVRSAFDAWLSRVNADRSAR